MSYRRHDAAMLAVLVAIGATDVVRADAQGRADANETMAFSRDLEAIYTTAIEQEFPTLRAREFFQVIPGIDPGAESFTWYEYTDVGLAKMIVNYAEDLPVVETYGTKNMSPIEGHAVAYMFSTQDLKAQSKIRRDVGAAKARIARESIERRVEQVSAKGHAERNIKGVLNNGSIPLLTSGLNGDWTNATPAEILEDLMTMAFAIKKQSVGRHGAGGLRMLLGTESYALVASKFMSEDGALAGTTILEAFLRSQKMVTSVEWWTYCDLADAQGNGERAMVYEPGLDNLGLVIPLDFEQHPPQAENLMFKVPCEGRIGGAVVFRPLSAVYVDALLDT